MTPPYIVGETAITTSGDPAVDGLRIMAANADENVRNLETHCEKLRRQIAQYETDIASNKAAAERMRSAADTLMEALL